MREPETPQLPELDPEMDPVCRRILEGTMKREEEFQAKQEAERSQREAAAREAYAAFQCALDSRYSVRLSVRLREGVAKLKRGVGNFLARLRGGA